MSHRNVVVVTADSLRADHCGFMGYDRDTTPTLDRMANEGIAFTNAISPGPSTPESMPVIFTGEYPVPRGAEYPSQLAARRAQIRRHMAARETLAERFSRAGYRTAAFTPNPYTSRYFGFDAGFDNFQDFMGGSRARLYQGLLNGVLEGVSKSSLLPARVLLNWIQREEVFKPWEAFYDEVVSLTERVEEPYFLWILLMDTHDPYLTPGDYRTQSQWAMYHANWRLWRQGHEPPFSATTHDRLVRAYDDSIRYADAFLDRLQSDLADDDPVFVVHGDHGEAFGEHGTYGHHAQLYEENIHVPFVIDGAERITVDRPFSLRHLPEVLPPVATKDTVSPLSTIDSIAESRTLDDDCMAVRGRVWKYLRNAETHELYHLNRGEDDELQADELRSVGRCIAEQWGEATAERRRIVDAAREIAEDTS